MSLPLRYTFLLLSIICLIGCSIEKRRYMSGYHIERFHSTHSNHTISEDNSKVVTLESKQSDYEINYAEKTDGVKECVKQEHFSITSNEVDSTSHHEIKKRNRVHSLKAHSTAAMATAPAFGASRNKSVHPDAFTSFISGLLALGCLVGIVATGLSPLILMIGLTIALLFFGLYAGKLARRAFKDMRYARDRYRGGGLAAAGLVLGILSIVALLGIFTIILLGVAFITFT